MFNNLWIANNIEERTKVLLVAENEKEVIEILNNYANNIGLYGEWRAKRAGLKDLKEESINRKILCINNT